MYVELCAKELLLYIMENNGKVKGVQYTAV